MKKKAWILLCLFIPAASTLSAEAVLLFGPGMGYAAQNTAAGHPWNATSLGFMEQSYIGMSDAWGFYTAEAIGIIFASADNGVSLSMGQYQALSLDILLGMGFKLPLAPSLTGIAGAGIYMGSHLLNPSNYSLSTDYAGGFGAGIGASLLYSLSLNWGIGVNVNVAYSFANPGDSALTMSPNAVSLFGGIGLSYSFYPSSVYPRNS